MGLGRVMTRWGSTSAAASRTPWTGPSNVFGDMTDGRYGQPGRAVMESGGSYPPLFDDGKWNAMIRA